jgi:hypothetical protein
LGERKLSLRALKDGLCTILFNAFLAGKVTTLRMKGGNTDELREFQRQYLLIKESVVDKGLNTLPGAVSGVSQRFVDWIKRDKFSSAYNLLDSFLVNSELNQILIGKTTISTIEDSEKYNYNKNAITLKPNDSKTKELQAELLSTIRSEFEHNIAQQIFISPQGWKLVKESKEEIIKIINLASSQIDENGNALDLSQKIFEIATQLEKLPTEITNEFLINELQKLF